MSIRKGSTIYLDANYLVAYGAKQTLQSQRHTEAKRLMAKMLVAKCTLLASPLVFDESWMGLRNQLSPKPKTVKGRIKQVMNPYLRKVGIRFVSYDHNASSFKDIKQELQQFTSQLLKLAAFRVVQLSDGTRGITSTLSKLGDFRPRDAFHITIAVDNKASHIMTNDKSLSKNCKNHGLSPVNF